LDVPDETVIEADIIAINRRGAIAGDCGSHGFLGTPGGVLSIFDPANSVATFVTGINSAGIIGGSYYEKKGAGTDTEILQHGFLRIPVEVSWHGTWEDEDSGERQ
jgi:hypothetical protein